MIFKKKVKEPAVIVIRKTEAPSIMPGFENDLTKEPSTILDTIERHVDEIRKALETSDCDEMVSIHVSRKMGIFHLDINKETYVRFNDEWRKLD